MSSYRPYFESQRERERGYRERDPGFDRRRSGRRYEEDDDERGSYFRGSDPYEPREWRARETFETDYPAHDVDSFGRARRFESFEDWERPREFSAQQRFERPFGVGGFASGRRGYRGAPSGQSRFASRYESPGRYAGRGPKNYQRSDERLKEEVCDLLTIDPDIDATDIEVSVQNGEVTLEGSVRARQMKRDAEDCVEATPGVHQVHNRIRVMAQEGSEAVHQPGSEERGSEERQGMTGVGRFWRGAH